MEARAFRSRDLMRAPALAWSIRKMHAGFRGLLAAWAVYIVFTYAALVSSPLRDAGFLGLFRRFEFFPFLPCQGGGFLPPAIWYLGIALSICTIILTAISVTSIAVEDLRGNIMFQTRDAFRFTRTHRSTALVSLVVLAMLPLVFIAGFAVAGLVCRLPVVGPLALAVAALPLFFWGLAAAAVTLVFLFGLVNVPVITAWSGEDVLETVLQAFSLVWSRPVKFLLLQVAARLITAVSVFLLGLLVLGAALLGLATLTAVAGCTVNELFTIALYRFPMVMDSEYAIRVISTLSAAIGTPFIADTTAVPATVRAAGWIAGFSMLLAWLWIASYGFGTFFSAQAIIYRVLRPGKDDGSAPSSSSIEPAGAPPIEKVEPLRGDST